MSACESLPSAIAPFGIKDSANREVRYAQLDGRPVDFGTWGISNGDQDGHFDSGVAQDLNFIGSDLPIAGGEMQSPGQTLVPYDDWANLVYEVIDGSTNVSPRRGGELTSEAVTWINENFPEPPSNCASDLDGDGDVGFGDLLFVLDAWGTSGGDADLDGDGTVGFGDLLVVLDAWGPC